MFLAQTGEVFDAQVRASSDHAQVSHIQEMNSHAQLGVLDVQIGASSTQTRASSAQTQAFQIML